MITCSAAEGADTLYILKIPNMCTGCCHL